MGERRTTKEQREMWIARCERNPFNIKSKMHTQEILDVIKDLDDSEVEVSVLEQRVRELEAVRDCGQERCQWVPGPCLRHAKARLKAEQQVSQHRQEAWDALAHRYADLEARLAESESEREEQARLLGMSGSREAALKAKLTETSEHNNHLVGMIEGLKKSNREKDECISLYDADVVHLKAIHDELVEDRDRWKKRCIEAHDRIEDLENELNDKQRRLDELVKAADEFLDWQNGVPLLTYDPPWVVDGTGYTASRERLEAEIEGHTEHRDAQVARDRLDATRWGPDRGIAAEEPKERQRKRDESP